MSHVKNVTLWGGGRVSIFVLNIITGNMQQATHTVNGIKKNKRKSVVLFGGKKPT